jgi:hypothetical protein
MADLAEPGGNRRADAPAGAVIADQVGKDGFEIAIAGHQRIIVGVADRRVVLAMIAGIMPGDGDGVVPGRSALIALSSVILTLQQGQRGGARLGGDLFASQHAGDFLGAGIVGQWFGGADHAAVCCCLGNPHMMIALCRDLR